jgi:uncharacterized protein
VFKKLRTEDTLLFEQLGRIAGHLSHAAALLERLVSGTRDAEAALAAEGRALGRRAEPAAQDADVHAFTAFVMRLDRMEYRELAITLDAAVEAVRDAAELAANLHASGAPAGVRALAERLSAAAVVIEAMLPHVSRAPAEVLRRCAGVRRLIAEGDTIYYDGVGALFLGAPDAVEVLRWKDIYGTLRHALQCCGRSAGVLAQVTRSNS